MTKKMKVYQMTIFDLLDEKENLLTPPKKKVETKNHTTVMKTISKTSNCIEL